MYYAVISDIHSNLEALTEVLREIRKRKPDKIISSGDVVGYGANPSECLKLADRSCDFIVMGNHDQAVEDLLLRDSFSENARIAIEWTAGVLSAEEKKLIRSWARLVIDSKAGITIAHGSPNEPEQYYYLLSSRDAALSFSSFSTPVCFIGHTHIPTIFSASGHSRYLSVGKYSLDKGDRYLINPGSVGQPRDQNTRTSFAFYDSDKLELEIVRLDYENWKTAEKIKKAGLPAYLAERLL